MDTISLPIGNSGRYYGNLNIVVLILISCIRSVKSLFIVIRKLKGHCRQTSRGVKYYH